jgi:hypothetical protein
VRQKSERSTNAESSAAVTITVAATETTGRPRLKGPVERIASERPAVTMPASVMMTAPFAAFLFRRAVASVIAAVTYFVVRAMRFLGLFPPNICRMHVVYLQLAGTFQFAGGVCLQKRSCERRCRSKRGHRCRTPFTRKSNARLDLVKRDFFKRRDLLRIVCLICCILETRAWS